MSIFLSTAADVSVHDGLGALLDNFGQITGIPGLSGTTSQKDFGVTKDIQAVQNYAQNVLNKLTGGELEKLDNNFVGSGKQLAIGSSNMSENGDFTPTRTSPLENANVRQVSSQTPNFSVLIKKKMFSSLRHLHKPELMDPGELWFIRATKQLIARKCAVMADYERLTKIQKLADLGLTPGAAISSLITGLTEGLLTGTDSKPNFFTSAMNLQRTMEERKPVNITTYFVNASHPNIEAVGSGSGVFEITAISRLSTSLNLDGSGDASFSIEDPYHILMVTEEDIEAAIKETALVNFTDIVNRTAGTVLSLAQTNDASLSDLRNANRKSPISFTVDLSGASEVRAVIDSIGYELTDQNIEGVPPGQELSSAEQRLFKSIYNGLKSYSNSMRSSLTRGLDSGFMSMFGEQDVKDNMKYTRKLMRKFNLGKCIIQPMDTVNVYIDSGTRRLGEGNDPFEYNILSKDGALKTAGAILGMQTQSSVDEDILMIEWEMEGQHLTFEDFKKLRISETSGNGTGIHVFGGIIRSVEDKYESESGSYILSVSCDPNIKFLSLSRYNKEPSLDQTQGLVLDPLTPFDFQVDAATGLPTGKPTLSKANQNLGHCNRSKSGDSTGKSAEGGKGVEPNNSAVVYGGNVLKLYQHVPGLVYKWKEGIMTSIYNAQTSDPKDKTSVDLRQLRRDMGFFASNTQFDNMDSANIISMLITGIPYNAMTFLRSALASGSYKPDLRFNESKDYFHSFFNMQREFNKVQGNFVPFKIINMSLDEVNKATKMQLQLSGTSSKIKQLRTQIAQKKDLKSNLDPSAPTTITIQNALLGDIKNLESQLAIAENEFNLSVNNEANRLSNSNIVMTLVGDDPMFDLEFDGSSDGNSIGVGFSQKLPVNYKIFGDRLAYLTLRRREDVINNRDKNYLIISDEYDKDYDIQAFALHLRKSSPNLWKSTWMPYDQLCRQVADQLNFELYTDTQGHIVFRPPQYNRTPLSILNEMFSLSQVSGIKIFPDFLQSLFETRAESLQKQVLILENKILMRAAILGASSVSEASLMATGYCGVVTFLFVNSGDNVDTPIKINNSTMLSSEEKNELLTRIKEANSETKVIAGQQSGLFSPKAQTNLLNSIRLGSLMDVTLYDYKKKLYDDAVKELVKIEGSQLRNYPSFEDAQIGSTTKSKSNPTPEADKQRVVSEMASLLSERSKVLKTLEKVLSQSIAISNTPASNNDNSFFAPVQNISLSSTHNFFSKGADTSVFDRLIENDSINRLGHLSGSRFIIKDESIKNLTFVEQPPEMTTVTVTGTDSIIGDEQGNLAGSSYPLYTAYGVDFDLWRQYGYRSDQTFHKPYFWSAEQQCAPYAVMLLSRQRKNIVKGSITVVGNEFYQLGDVVYVLDRQLLFYVTSIQHNIDYGEGFTTTLQLSYGHAPGEYIPTPLDLIGKGLVNSSIVQTGFRVNRQTPSTEQLYAVIKFDPEHTDEPLVGEHATANYEAIINVLTKAKGQIDDSSPSTSPRIYCVAFSDNQPVKAYAMAASVAELLVNPQQISAQGNSIGPTIGTSAPMAPVNGLSYEAVHTQVIKQCLPDDQLDPTDANLLRLGLGAGDESFFLDKTLKTVVEIRLRSLPAGGWPASDEM